MITNLNLLANKKNCVTVSSATAGSMANLQAIHTAKPTFAWGAPTVATAWMKVNFYEQISVTNINLGFTGSCSNITIEWSIDNWNWYVLSPTFTPATSYLKILYSISQDLIFIRFTIGNPNNFVINILEIFANFEYETRDFISQNSVSFYGPEERNLYPFLPSIAKNILEMFEANSTVNLKLFDPIIFSTATLTNGVIGSTLTLNTTGMPIDSSYQYIYDFNDNGSSDNIRVTTDATTPQSHTYTAIGIYVPRLILNHGNFMIEFTNFYNKTV